MSVIGKEVDGQVRDVCKIGQGHACCRYLAASGRGFECLKGTELQRELDRRIAEQSMNARGDNCPGWKEEQDGIVV